MTTVYRCEYRDHLIEITIPIDIWRSDFKEMDINVIDTSESQVGGCPYHDGNKLHFISMYKNNEPWKTI